MDIAYKLAFDSLTWTEPGDGTRFKAYQQDGYQLRLVEFSNNMVHPEWCRRGHMAYVLEGQMELDFDGRTELFEKGDVMFIPDGDEHRHRPKALTERVVFFSVEKI